MNLKEDKDKILKMLMSTDSELRELAVDYIRNNYDTDVVVPLFLGFSQDYDNLEQTQTADWQLSSIEEGYDDDFMVENLINAIIEHNKL